MPITLFFIVELFSKPVQLPLIFGFCWDFTKIHWKSVRSTPSFQVILHIIQKIYEKKCLWHGFIQNFIRILVDTIILAVTLILLVKNTNKVDLSEIQLFEVKTSNGSTLFAFFTHKMRLTAKIIVFTRILMKFWINPCLKHFVSHFFVWFFKRLEKLEWNAQIFNVF